MEVSLLYVLVPTRQKKEINDFQFKSCIRMDEARRSMCSPHSPKPLESDLPHFLLQVEEQPLEFSRLRKETVGGIP